MIRATVITAFPGVLDGQVLPREFAKGDEISGELAVTAIAQKLAKETKDSIAEREQADGAAAALLKQQQDDKAQADLLAAKKVVARKEFDLATAEQIAKGAETLKVDLDGVTDRDAIFERIWAAMVAQGKTGA